MSNFFEKYINGFIETLDQIDAADFQRIQHDFDPNQFPYDWVVERVSDVKDYLLNPRDFSDVETFKSTMRAKIKHFYACYSSKIPFFLFTSFVLAIFNSVRQYVKYHCDLDFTNPDAVTIFFREKALND